MNLQVIENHARDISWMAACNLAHANSCARARVKILAVECSTAWRLMGSFYVGL